MAHRAVPGGYDPSQREGKRTAVYGERPFFDPENSYSLSEKPEFVEQPKINGTKGTNGANGANETNGTNGIHETEGTFTLKSPNVGP